MTTRTSWLVLSLFAAVLVLKNFVLTTSFVLQTTTVRSRHLTGRTSSASTADETTTNMPVTTKDSTKTQFRDKTIFLTGATGGLGTALALQLTQCGIKTLIISARQAAALASLTQQCQQINPNLVVHTLVCDLANSDQVQETAQAAVKLGPIDVLINNGGVSSRSSFLDTDLSVDAKVMQINFLAGAAFCKALVPGMVDQSSGGRIIWISSVQGLVGIPNRSSYAASKFAVQGYTESIRAELQSSGVTVHTVSPGYIRTNLSNSAITGDGTKYGKTDATTAAGADPNDVAVQLLDRIVTRGEVDFTIAATTSAVAAVYLRTLCPGLLRSLLVRRYEKETRNSKTKSD